MHLVKDSFPFKTELSIPVKVMIDLQGKKLLVVPPAGRTKQWLPSLRLVMFAGLWEWVIQALAAVGFIAISANLPQLVVPGWKIATLVYFVIWIISVVFDALHRAPKRQAIEEESIRALRGLR